MESLYQCTRCGYAASKKAYLYSHLRRKRECPPLLSDLSVEQVENSLYTRERPFYDQYENKYVCRYCNSKFISSNTKCNHMKICKARATEALKQDFFLKEQALLHEIQQLKQKTISNTNTTSTISYNTSNANTFNNYTTYNNHIHNTINILNFGSENTSCLTPDFLKKCLQHCQPNETLPEGGINGIAMVMQKLHDQRENKTVRINSKIRSVLDTHVSDEWVAADKDTVLESMVDKGYRIIKTFQLDNADLENNDVELQGIMDDISEYLDKVDALDPDVRKPIKRALYIMLVNQKKLVVLGR